MSSMNSQAAGKRDELLDLAAELVQGGVDRSKVLGDVIVSLPTDDLRQLVGRLVIMTKWAAEADGLEDLFKQVELMQLRRSGR